jgi:hypothetical protein
LIKISINTVNIKDLLGLKKILSNNNQKTEEVEYIENNYDNFVHLIKDKLSTITTDYCEIGLYIIQYISYLLLKINLV